MFYVVVDEDGQFVPDYPDLRGQGGCQALNGEHPVIKVFKNKKIAGAWRAFLQQFADDDRLPHEPKKKYSVQRADLSSTSM